jgi:hypothetical protein
MFNIASLSQLGPLRVILFLATLLVALTGPFLDGNVDVHSWRILPTVIAPALMLILLFVLPLDITMAAIFMTAVDSTQKGRLRYAIKFEIGLMAALVLAWTPYFFRFFAR